MPIKISKLNHTGQGIGQINKQIVFVDKALPGDIVELTNIINHKNYLTAQIKKIITKSPSRIPILCPYYQNCGGCHLMGLSYQEQLKYKQEKVTNILNKYTHLNINPQIIPSHQYHYRNKITLHVKNGQVGLYSQNSNDLIPITKCLLVTPQINEIIAILSQDKNLSQVSQITIRDMQDKLMLQFQGNITKENISPLLKEKASSLYINNDLAYGLPQLINILGNYQYKVSPNSFFQVNHDQTLKLYSYLKNNLPSPKPNVLDLYCGSGTIGIFISNHCQKVTGIEKNPSSVKDALENIKINKIKNVNIIKGDVGKILKPNHQYDTIIVDPPRSGLDKNTRQTLLQLNSKQIIYVSCNPLTLARDLNDLQANYKIDKLTLIDMFPNTYHVECCTLLTLRENHKPL